METGVQIGHLVLQVPDLGTAPAWLAALGFTVAADAHNPFGTSNFCVFLPDGSYLEPLAIGDRQAVLLLGVLSK